MKLLLETKCSVRLIISTIHKNRLSGGELWRVKVETGDGLGWAATRMAPSMVLAEEDLDKLTLHTTNKHEPNKRLEGIRKRGSGHNAKGKAGSEGQGRRKR